MGDIQSDGFIQVRFPFSQCLSGQSVYQVDTDISYAVLFA